MRSWCRGADRCRSFSSIPRGPARTRRRKSSATPGGCVAGWPPQLGPGPHVLMGGQDRPLVADSPRPRSIDSPPRILADARLVAHRRCFCSRRRAEVSLLDPVCGTGRKPDSGGGREFRSRRLGPIAAWRDGLGILPAPLAPTAPGLCPRRSPWATATDRTVDARL